MVILANPEGVVIVLRNIRFFFRNYFFLAGGAVL